MKVMLVNGSSHAHGTTMKALEEMIHTFEAEGVETEVVQLGSKPFVNFFSGFELSPCLLVVNNILKRVQRCCVV